MGGGEGIVKASKGYSESGGEGRDELTSASMGAYMYISRSWLGAKCVICESPALKRMTPAVEVDASPSSFSSSSYISGFFITQGDNWILSW